ncbi:cysteine--tRNA ligase [Rhizosphaericola mali]|uniref:Cysteine--tRNA ligase n=1 Tax=Rhizosphaericola mali TaxID=2545455 RepID=A0A5P2G6M2_9BACT|nr:cysteine--tRNA ligase [Rhizosphaericola mali]QES90358.1 cysteine--tRNA ligase [Rhizosphaericola mali]
MSQLKVYNSLTREKEVFESITPGHVGMYVCGPTVSGESHLGHARPFITFDIVYRYLLYLGNKVRYVRNITDAGHFEEEGRAAEDKISNKAILEKLEPMELVQKYTNLFHWGMKAFNTLDPSIEPTATGHIIEQINMIEKIIADGYAYETNGSVYFDVEKYNKDFSKKDMPYGILSGRILDEQEASTRDLANQDEKRNKSDFALWKNAPPEHLMRWTSPWGEGFPGWHIECSAMSTKYLGEEFDIHGGGMDLQFPHHECEIAQSVVSNHKIPARYWLHNNMITINGKKMGKSYNNVIKLTELFSGNHPILEQAYHPMVIRFFILQTHYRSTLDFSNEALQASEKGLKRLWEGYESLLKLNDNTNEIASDLVLDKKLNALLDELDEFMNDDFNTAKALANMFEIISISNSIKDGHLSENTISASTMQLLKTKMKAFVEGIFGLQPITETSSDKLDGAIQILIEMRKEAKANKDYMTSDKIRNELATLGIMIKDEKGGNMTYSFA